MQRINVMVSDEAKAILVKFQDQRGYRKLDDALDALIKEHKK